MLSPGCEVRCDIYDSYDKVHRYNDFVQWVLGVPLATCNGC